MAKRQFKLKADLETIVGGQKFVSSGIGPVGEVCLLVVEPKLENEPFRQERSEFAVFECSKPNRG